MNKKAAVRQTRESWLLAAIREIRPLFAAKGAKIPAGLRVSVGFPKGARGGSSAVGQCFTSASCADGKGAIFISPKIEDPIRCLDILVHELVHATDNCDSGHGGAFKRLATALGLEGKMTATTAGKTLAVQLRAIAKVLGKYPHSALTFSSRAKKGSRLLKAECLRCGYVVRVTAKWLNTGTPLCPCNKRPMKAGL